MFKILVMKNDQWFYTEKQLVLILKMMIQPLILTCLTPFSTQMASNVNREEEVNDVLTNHNDHDEGELINIV